MISRTKINRTLNKALDAVDPSPEPWPNIKRKRINYPMLNFRNVLKQFADEYKSINTISFDFSEENIEKQLTVVLLKTETRRVRLSYDYKTDNVECFCVGKDCDAISKTVPVSELFETAREFFPQKKVVKIVRKRA